MSAVGPPLHAYGLTGATVTGLEGGMVNLVSRVDHAGRSYALKQYAANLVTPARVLEICRGQETARVRGLPAPRVVPNLAGELYTVHAGLIFVLADFLDGRQYPPGTMPPGAAREMGATLRGLYEALDGVLPGDTDELPHPQAIERRLRDLLGHAEARRESNVIDANICLILKSKLQALERIERPVLSLERQCIHADYTWRNVLFDREDRVSGIIDFDNLRLAYRGHDVMRCFDYSFEEGAPEALAFFEGYARASAISPQEARDYVDYWRYTSTSRVWPIPVRYFEPHIYQTRWDEFLTPPTPWWDDNWDRLSDQFAAIAGKVS